MTGSESPRPGDIAWHDLTVADATRVQAFYAAVTGWTVESVAMDGYSDYCMAPPGGDAPVAGICHARGPNAGLPPQWLLYVVVDDLDARLAQVDAHGGHCIDGPRELNGGRMAVVRDPAGAVIALWQS